MKKNNGVQTLVFLVGVLCLALIPTSKCVPESFARVFANVQSIDGVPTRYESGTGATATTTRAGAGGGFRSFGPGKRSVVGGTLAQSRRGDGSFGSASNNVKYVGNGNLRVGGGTGVGNNGTNAATFISATGVHYYKGSSSSYARGGSGRRLKVVLF